MAKTLTIQFMVRFSHLTVQVPKNKHRKGLRKISKTSEIIVTKFKVILLIKYFQNLIRDKEAFDNKCIV